MFPPRPINTTPLSNEQEKYDIKNKITITNRGETRKLGK
jgi:hypothetical protein